LNLPLLTNPRTKQFQTRHRLWKFHLLRSQSDPTMRKPPKSMFERKLTLSRRLWVLLALARYFIFHQTLKTCGTTRVFASLIFQFVFILVILFAGRLFTWRYQERVVITCYCWKRVRCRSHRGPEDD
jgi:hypothetical protein